MIERMEEKFPGLRHMKPVQARQLREIIRDNALNNLLELGTYHGKSTGYMALIQEERGVGHVTTLDRENAQELSPNAEQVAAALGVSHRVTVKRAKRSFTHTLMQMLEEAPRPVFDFVYLDGAHTWDGTGFTFFLTDKLLRPGGWMVLDDLDWTLANAKTGKKKALEKYTAEEIATPMVRKVWELLVPEAGYVNRREWKRWGIAQKSPSLGL